MDNIEYDGNFLLARILFLPDVQGDFDPEWGDYLVT